MPTSDRGIHEVTEAVTFAVVGDRLHFTLQSGPCARTFAIGFQRARAAASDAVFLLDGERRRPSNVCRFRRK